MSFKMVPEGIKSVSLIPKGAIFEKGVQKSPIE